MTSIPPAIALALAMTALYEVVTTGAPAAYPPSKAQATWGWDGHWLAGNTRHTCRWEKLPRKSDMRIHQVPSGPNSYLSDKKRNLIHGKIREPQFRTATSSLGHVLPSVYAIPYDATRLMLPYLYMFRIAYLSPGKIYCIPQPIDNNPHVI